MVPFQSFPSKSHQCLIHAAAPGTRHGIVPTHSGKPRCKPRFPVIIQIICPLLLAVWVSPGLLLLYQHVFRLHLSWTRAHDAFCFTADSSSSSLHLPCPLLSLPIPPQLSLSGPLSQFSGSRLYHPITGCILLLPNSLKLGSKVYTIKASVHDDALARGQLGLGVQNLATPNRI